ncbi:MAG: PEP-CTERM sorting domain-containing protein [Fuerstiella sp.]
MKYFFVTTAVLIAVTVGPRTPVSASIITNSGFEDTNADGTFGDGWGRFGAADFNAFFGANAHASFFLDNSGNSGGVFQQGIAGVAGTEYRFTLEDLFIESNAAASNFDLGLEFYQADDSTLILSTQTSIVPLTSGSGLTFSHTAVAPVGTQFVRPVITFSGADGSAANSENVFVFNTSLASTSLAAVPEPSSAAFLAFASATFLVVRRRRHRHAARF